MIDLNLDKLSGVYVIRADDSGFVKIGRAVNIPDRLKTLQTASVASLTLERVFETPGHAQTVSLEKKLHTAYRDRRVRGEWFRLTRHEVINMPDWDQLSGSDRRAMTAFLDGLGVGVYVRPPTRVASVEDLAKPAPGAAARKLPYPGFTCDEFGYDSFGVQWTSHARKSG